ncbi:cysteine desulfurase [Rhodobacteraceae bacterium RKSG542]|uniref:cysteine desulfurase family protein n=1 Tax=Pseudovibrio flavus TaxID=2529854 RepID=UPI0012BC48B1|nr:cysteine desulfurase family protein [Pseudovibrio flavus]MTI15795.1 cysteine desulfurase [Pseudovibrio flavus]
MSVTLNLTYLDHNAGAPTRPQAIEAMVNGLSTVGNASSIHAAGRGARGRMEAARKEVAALLDAIPQNIVFTSGGTEANVTALSPVWMKNGEPFTLSKLFVSAVEHPSVLSGGRFAPENIEIIPVDKNGVVDIDYLRDMLAKVPEGETALVSVMAANSETGVLQPIQEIGVLVEDAGHLFHVDAVQLAGRQELSIGLIGCHALSISSHKLGGPQGVGALVLGKGDLRPAPLLKGGGQEAWRRAGTENAAGIGGFAAAVAAHRSTENEYERLIALRETLEQGLKKISPEATIFGEGASRLPNTTCFSVTGIAAETALISFDLSGVAVSSGSACSSGKVGISHVLKAMGVEEQAAKGAIRVSIGWSTQETDITRFLEAWAKIYQRMGPAKQAARTL